MLKLNNRIVLNIIKSYEDYGGGGDVEMRDCSVGEILDGDIYKTYGKEDGHFCDVKFSDGKIAVGIPERFLQKVS